MKEVTQALLDLIAGSPSPFHAAANFAAALEAAGYRRLREESCWQLQGGGRYFVERNGSALIAFRVPEGEWQGFQLTAAHSDSPAFKLKPQGELAGPENYLRLNAEPYGGMLMATWLDRPLSVAGRAAVRTAAGVASRLVNLDRDLLVIPSVAIHMDREANRGRTWDPKTDLTPVLGLGTEKGTLRRLVAEAAAVPEEDLLGGDLFLYVRQPGTALGANEELVAGPRLDDLQCAFACFHGFLEAGQGGGAPVFCLFDNEEVGSATRQGADGTFLQETLGRICAALGREDPAELAASVMVSADNAHAVHPNHPEYADCGHRPRLNGGVVVKHSASQRYTSDAVSAALFTELCRRCGVPTQVFANRSDLPGGSTLGNISNTHVSLTTVDVGLAQLAMHSAWETAGAEDTEHLLRAARAFYEAALRPDGQGGWEIGSR